MQKPRNLNSRSLAGPTARLPSNSNAVASGNGTSFHCLLPRLPWLYSHQIAILAAAQAASGARSPTRIQSSATAVTSRYAHPLNPYPACVSCSHLPCPHVLVDISQSVCHRCVIFVIFGPVGRPRAALGAGPECGRSQVSFALAGHNLWPASAHLWH